MQAFPLSMHKVCSASSSSTETLWLEDANHGMTQALRIGIPRQRQSLKQSGLIRILAPDGDAETGGLIGAEGSFEKRLI